jgi:DNA-binding NarL/FixJ family response regulator
VTEQNQTPLTSRRTGNDASVVAVFNASEDTVDFVTVFFQLQGFRAVGRTWPAREALDSVVVLGFMAQHRPHVIVFDVSFPYESNWQRFLEFRELGHECRVPVVLTTTNKDALTECIGSTEALEIVGKPYDLDELLTAVRRALASRRDAEHRQVSRPVS